MNWAGRTLQTIGNIGAGSDGESKMQQASNSMFNTCRFALYRQFYAEEHKRLKAEAGAALEGEIK